MLSDLWIFVIPIARELREAYAALGVLFIEEHGRRRCVLVLVVKQYP